MVARKWILVLMAIPLASVIAAADAPASLESLLKSFAGEWEGHLSVRSVEGFEEQLLLVRQRYWWDTVGLRGEAFYGEGEREFRSSSLAVVMDGKIVSEVEWGGQVTLLRGVVAENSILWLPFATDAEPALQMRETLEVDDMGRRRIRISGHEIRPSQLQSRRYLYRGTLNQVF
jgi:hypothetical protein